MTASTIDISNSSAVAATHKALASNIIPGVILAMLIGAVLGLLSFLLGLGNIISGMLGALGALALVWFGARCITGGIKNNAARTTASEDTSTNTVSDDTKASPATEG